MVARLVDPLAAADRQFGYSVAVDGDTIAIGSRLANLGPIAQTGSVDIFQKSAPNGSWNHIQKLQPRDLNGGDYFGTSVSLHSNALVIGSPKSGDLGDQAGKAYVFVRTQASNSWVEVCLLYTSDAADE